MKVTIAAGNSLPLQRADTCTSCTR